MRFSTLVFLALEVLPSLALPQGDKATRSVGTKLAAAAPAGQVAIKALTAGDAKTTMQGGSEADTAIVTGVFGSLNIAVGGSKRQNIVMPANSAGAIEVEYNSTVGNKILVAPKMASVPPPAGMVYVDPLTFIVTTETPGITGDILKIDYKFSFGTKERVNPAAVLIGKLDPATNQFVTTGLGEFEVKEGEGEWSLIVKDLNGEWAILVPTTGLLTPEEEK